MTDSYPPDNSVPRVTIDLDMDPFDRWAALVSAQAGDIAEMITQFISHLEVGPLKVKIPELIAQIDAGADSILAKMQYGEEVRGIAAATGIDLAEVILFNLGYELMGVCTSIVAQDESGHTFHGRNLDFGLFLGHESINSTFQWTNTDQLRKLVSIVDFTRGGAVLHSGVVYAGYVGLLTGVRKSSVTVR